MTGTEDEIARYYWPQDRGPIPAWFRAAISDAVDTGIAFAVRRAASTATFDWSGQESDCREAQDNTPSKGPFPL